MLSPATSASPEVGGNSVVSILIRVLLPAPLEPSKPNIFPLLMVKETLSTAKKSPNRQVNAITLSAMA